jgi:hypothetical protein
MHAWPLADIHMELYRSSWCTTVLQWQEQTLFKHSLGELDHSDGCNRDDYRRNISNYQ